MSSVKLREVFGVATDVPKYTYVDRQKLDQKFSYYLKSQKHIVVHGASKQGKSCLRKKTIEVGGSLDIQCLPKMESVEEVWRTALQRAGVKVPVSSSKAVAKEIHGDVSIQGQAGLPMIGKIEGGASGGAKKEETEGEERSFIQADSFLPTLAAYLREENKRLILEDFHYLPDDIRKDIAHGLKALYEEKAYVVIIGIWSEQNLLTYYNGDLTGRIEEINLTWNNDELSQVLSKGEGALNIEFAPGIRTQILESAFENVGLLQRIAEKVCIEAGIFESQPSTLNLSDIGLLRKAHEQMVEDIRQRYTRLTEVFKEGMRSDAALLLYARIYNEIVGASDAELKNGISYVTLFDRIQRHSGSVNIRREDLTSALDRVERLQARKGVTPLLVSYSKSLRQLFLNDREFMFYRKYSGDNVEDLKISIS